MKTDGATRKRGTLTRYNTEERARLIREQAESGLSKREFCEREGINLATFYGWSKAARAGERKPTFAEVEVASSAQAAVEVLLPNGVRVGICHQGKREDLVGLVRGICGC